MIHTFLFPESSNLKAVSIDLDLTPSKGDDVWFSTWEAKPLNNDSDFHENGRHWKVKEVHWSFRIYADKPLESSMKVVEVHLIKAGTIAMKG